LVPKLILTSSAALAYSLLLCRQVGVVLRIADSKGLSSAKRLPWLFTGAGSVMSLAYGLSIFLPGLPLSRGRPDDAWIGLFIALSVASAGVGLLLGARRPGS
jgi:hypothetical protein